MDECESLLRGAVALAHRVGGGVGGGAAGDARGARRCRDSGGSGSGGGGKCAAGGSGCQSGDGHGRAVQVDPLKPMLKPPGTKRLKLNYDILLSTSAFKFNLRCYTMATEAAKREAAAAAEAATWELAAVTDAAAWELAAAKEAAGRAEAAAEAAVVGWCRLTL